MEFHRGTSAALLETWPKNFMIAFVVEAALAQPVARLVMRAHHRRVDRRSAMVEQLA